MSTPKKTNELPLTYRGHEILLNGDDIWYGNMADKVIINMKILDRRTIDGVEMAGNIAIFLQYTDPNIKSRDRIIKKSEKLGIYAAMDIASIWLERALEGKM